jgi:mRNA interferase MazF
MYRGEVVHLRSQRGLRGHEQRGSRFAVIVQTNELLAMSTVIVAPTSTAGRPTSFRPQIEVDGQHTLVMVDHIASVDLSRIGESVRTLTWGEQMDVDRALKLVLGLAG